MLSFSDLLLFALAALVLAVTPGPNMVYLISRSICQGRKAGIISLFGVIAGFIVHALSAAAGISAVFLALPMSYHILRITGAVYLLWLAWEAVRPGAHSPFDPVAVPPESPQKLFAMGFLTNLFNPKVALFYLSLFPQFISPERGSVFIQSVLLGCIQISVSFSVNILITLSAAHIASWFSRYRFWLSVQRYLMGLVLTALAARLLFDERR